MPCSPFESPYSAALVPSNVTLTSQPAHARLPPSVLFVHDEKVPPSHALASNSPPAPR